LRISAIQQSAHSAALPCTMKLRVNRPQSLDWLRARRSSPAVAPASEARAYRPASRRQAAVTIAPAWY